MNRFDLPRAPKRVGATVQFCRISVGAVILVATFWGPAPICRG
jgi:hypothetical protein